MKVVERLFLIAAMFKPNSSLLRTMSRFLVMNSKTRYLQSSESTDFIVCGADDNKLQNFASIHNIRCEIDHTPHQRTSPFFSRFRGDIQLSCVELHRSDSELNWLTVMAPTSTTILPSDLLQNFKYKIELQSAFDAVYNASFISRSLQAKLLAHKSFSSKSDMSPVTIADFAVQAFIIDHLSRTCPDIVFVAEEDSSLLRSDPSVKQQVLQVLRDATGETWAETRLFAALDRGGYDGPNHLVWVLDPIDGTKGFLRGEQFCVALALLVDGSPVLSVVGCPNLDNRKLTDENTEKVGSWAPGPAINIKPSSLFLYGPRSGSVCFAASGLGAFCCALGGLSEVQQSSTTRVKRVRTSRASQPSEMMLCESAESSHGDRATSQRVFSSLGLRNDIVRLDGQTKHCVVGCGAAHGSLRLPPTGYVEKIWDHVPGCHFVTEAGGRVSDQRGAALSFRTGRFLHPNVTGILTSCGGNHHNHILDILTSTRATHL